MNPQIKLLIKRYVAPMWLVANLASNTIELMLYILV